jgi:class 3 adenylate cyclase
MVDQPYTRSLSEPDDLVELPTVRSATVTLGGFTVSHDLHQPGWRWSTDVRPIVGTEWCMLRHIGVVLRGRLGVVLDDGTEFECGPLDLMDIPPRHDAWVVGDEPVEMIGWIGVRGWLEPSEALRERVLMSVVFTDIVDSTKTAVRLGAHAWSELVAHHEAMARDTLSRFNGREIRMTGDGVLAIFDSPARAVRCARALVEVGADLRLGMRAAVHTGEVEIAGDDLRGVAVHEAARILDLAGGGEVLVSAVTAGLVADAGFTIEDRGEHPMKGLDGARRVFAVS